MRVPCDDCNWNEYDTINEGFKQGILKFPFTVKFYHDDFQSIDSYEEYKEILNRVIEFRIKTIKTGWALKYGLEYDGVEYKTLEEMDEKELLAFQDPRPGVNWQLEEITMKHLD